MNLKSKLQHKATAVVQIISDTQCIYSDEVSATHIDALTIIEASDKEQLWTKIQAKASDTASKTRFQPIILIITQDQQLRIHKMPKVAVKPQIEEYDPNA